MRNRRVFLTLLGGLLTLFSPIHGTAAAAPERPLTVLAAASLTNAMTECGKAFTARTKVPVRFSFASSSVLARQVEAGAPADLFVSADLNWMDYVQARGLIDRGSRFTLAKGRLALIAPADSKLALPIGADFPLAKALGRGRLAMGDPDFVPAGSYGRAALTSLGVWADVADRLARAENVRFALALVARKEAPLGIVYETDARIDPKVRIVALFPESSHPPIVYPAALTRKAAPGAAAFRNFLRSDEARAIFHRFGFLPLN